MKSFLSRKWKWRQHVGLFITLALLGVPLGLSIKQARTPDRYAEGMEIYREKGPEAAREYFHYYASRGDLPSQNGVAWLDYRNRDYQSAEYHATFVADEAQRPIDKARACYLLGMIKKKSDDFDRAYYRFGEALTSYLADKDKLGAFRCRCELAACRIWSGDPLSALEHLAKAEKELPSASNLGVVRFYQSQAKWLLEEKDKALLLAKESVQLAEVHDPIFLPSALGELGQQLMLTGDYEQGKRMVDRALGLEADQYRRVFLKINLVIHARCTGGEPGPIVDETREFLGEHPSSILEGLLNNALSVDCEQE